MLETPFARVPVAEETEDALEEVRAVVAAVVFALVARVVAFTTCAVDVTVAHQDDGMNERREKSVNNSSKENVNIFATSKRICDLLIGCGVYKIYRTKKDCGKREKRKDSEY